MQIKSFKKQKSGLYKIILDNNEEILLYEDLILKYELLIHKTLDKKKLDAILLDNQKQAVYYAGVQYLKKKRRSQKEVQEYLIKRDFDLHDVDEAIKKLVQQHYIDDRSYASSYLHDKMILTNEGPNKIKMELLKKGVLPDIVDQVMVEYDVNAKRQKINKIINKQITTNHNKSNKFLKEKILNVLLNLGFDKEDINNEIMQIEFPNDIAIKEQEYTKLLKKLGKKYSGKELEYKVRQKMYAKGFNNEND